jgi:hypothetical protein
MGYANLLPVQQQVVEKLALYSSIFGTGYLLGGVHDAIYFAGEKNDYAHSVSHM